MPAGGKPGSGSRALGRSVLCGGAGESSEELYFEVGPRYYGRILAGRNVLGGRNILGRSILVSNMALL